MDKEQELLKKVYKNRESLEKQDAWADSIMKKDFMRNVVVEEHSYGDEEREKLDYIYPKNRPKGEKLPIFLYFHGGGWIAGCKEARRVYCGKFAERNYFVANIEYSLAPEARFPVAIGQCMKAVDYVLDHAEKYGLDTTRIATGGESAGVYYAAYVAAISKEKSILQKLHLPQMHHLEFDVKVNMFNCAAVDLKLMSEKGFPGVEVMMEAYTGFDFQEIRSGKHDKELEAISPLAWIDERYPPTFMIYGSLDSLRFNTFRLRDLFEKHGVQYRLYKGTGIFYGQHTTAMILKGKKAFRMFEETQSYMHAVLNGQA